jgi:hypothetical protein
MFKQMFKMSLLALVCAVLVSCGGSKRTVAVVVDQVTYEKIATEVDAYVAAITNSSREGVLVVDKWFNPDSIKAELFNMYKNNNLEGAVFIGDIPIPMIRDAQHLTTAFKMDQKRRMDWSSVPSDRFYDDDPDSYKEWMKMGVLGVEMESAALYSVAARLGKKALTVLTVSDILETGEKLSSEERQTSFDDMVLLALNLA